jgi:hypothetical protein
MTVRFEIDLPDGDTITESELGQQGEAEKLLAARESLEGGLALINPATGQSTAIGDVLGALISRFCFQSIPVLAANREYSTYLFQYPEQVSMTPEGDEVVVTGDEIDRSHYPKRELLPALVECGERYAAYLRKLHRDDPSWAGRLETLETEAKNARAQLPAATTA